MAEGVDTSSYGLYSKVGTPMDFAAKLQDLKKNQLTITKQHLDLMNQGYGYILREVNSLGPNAKPEAMAKAVDDAVHFGLVPPDAAETFKSTIPTDPALMPDFVRSTATRLLDSQASINNQFGNFGFNRNGQQTTPVTTSPIRGMRAVGPPSQDQIPPGATIVDPVTQQPKFRGPQPPQLPAGTAPAPGGIPGQFNVPSDSAPPALKPAAPAPMMPRPAPNRLPVAGASAGGTENAAPQNMSQLIQNRGMDNFYTNKAPAPTGNATAAPPQFEEGKKYLNDDLDLATKRMTAIKPVEEVLKIIGNTTTGPTTETINYLKNILSNSTGKIIKGNDPQVVLPEVTKLLSMYIASSPIAQRSDAAQALSEASSPSAQTHINPALIKIAKDAIALDKVQSARGLSYKNRKDLENYNQYRASFPQNQDVEAYKFGTMSPDEQKKVYTEMYQKYKAGDKNAEKFLKSLRTAKDVGMF